MVEVEPGVLHRVELRKDKYEYYRADLSAVAARKVSFDPVLDLRPGSIRVETTPPGAVVRLSGTGKFLKTRGTFEDIAPGSYTLAIYDVLINRRYYTSAKSFAVEVNADEQAVLSQEMVPGTASLEFQGAPASSNVLVDGTVWRPGQDIPAGTLDIVVISLSSQTWGEAITASPGSTIRLSMDSLVASIPRRTIKVDGKTDDWSGIESLWGGVREKGDSYWFQPPTSKTNPFPNQTGTRLAAAFVSRDDSNIYLRLDFDNGAVSMNLSSDIKENLTREIHCLLASQKVLIANVQSSKRWGVSSWVGIWDNAARQSTNLGTLNAYAMSGSTLEMAIPLSRVQKYLEAGPLDVEISVCDSGPNGWYSGYSTYRRPIDFLK